MNTKNADAACAGSMPSYASPRNRRYGLSRHTELGVSSLADYFIICSGKSSRQVQGIADNLERGLKNRGIKPLGSEGRQEGHWVLMDYADVIIHIFYEPVRSFYDLESLWSEASIVDWEKYGGGLAAGID